MKPNSKDWVLEIDQKRKLCKRRTTDHNKNIVDKEFTAKSGTCPDKISKRIVRPNNTVIFVYFSLATKLYRQTNDTTKERLRAVKYWYRNHNH